MKKCYSVLHSSSFGLINTFVLVNSDILLERERERERERETQAIFIYDNVAYTREYTHFSFSKNFPLALFFIEFYFKTLSRNKVLKKIAVRIPLTAKHVLYPYFKNNIYKIKNKVLLSGIDAFYVNTSKVYIGDYN